MTYFVATLIVLLLFILAMAIGVIVGKSPLKGSCGGLGGIMGKDCEICGNRDKCEKNKNKPNQVTSVG